MIDVISLSLEFCSCLLLQEGDGGEGQIPVVVYQETMSVCHVEVLAYRGVSLAPSNAHRNAFTGSATLGNQWLYALPSCRCGFMERQGSQNRLKALFLPPLPLFKTIPTPHDGGGTLQPFIATVAVWCKRYKAYRAG